MTFSVSLSISPLPVVLCQGLRPPEHSLMSCYYVYRCHHVLGPRPPHQAEAAAGQVLTVVVPSFLTFIWAVFLCKVSKESILPNVFERPNSRRGLSNQIYLGNGLGKHPICWTRKINFGRKSKWNETKQNKITTKAPSFKIIIQPSVDWQLSWFQLFAIVSKARINMRAQIFL